VYDGINLMSDGSKTYLELIVERAIAYLELELSGEVRTASAMTDYKSILRVHSVALDLLRLLISDSSTPDSIISTAKDCLVQKLRQSTRQHHLLLQPQMLSLLQLAMAHSNTFRLKHQRKRSVLEKAEVVPESEFELALIQAIIEAVSSPQNRSSLRHWVDFILDITPSIESRPSLVLMLCECFSDQLRRDVLQLKAIRQVSGSGDVKSGLSESEVLFILAGLERLILIVVSSGRERTHGEDGSKPQGEGGLMGLVSGVFTVEAPINDKVCQMPTMMHPADIQTSDTVQYLDDAINALLLTWSVTTKQIDPSGSSVSPPLADSPIRTKARSVLDKMFTANSAAVIGSAVQVWAANSPDIAVSHPTQVSSYTDPKQDEAIFDCIDTLAPSAQKVVEIISEAVTGRGSRAGETSSVTSGPSASTADSGRSDPALMGFLEVYVSRLEAPIALQVWNTLFTFARNIIATSNPSTKAQLYPVLRCVTTLCKTVSSTSALEDRRLRRDLQDVYLKLLDGVVSNAGRSAEVTVWQREASRLDQKVDGEQDGLRDIQDFVAQRVVPSLRAFLADNDKIANAANSISTGLVVPAFRRQG
jgi:hypothetical protein